MNNQIEVIPEVTASNGRVITTSQAIADYFTKRHDDVLKKIRNLECSPEFRLRNFAETSYLRKNPNGGEGIPTTCYEITRDGFAFLGMGFTGAKAAKFKEAYINAFNKMEAALVAQPPAIAAPSNCRVMHTYDHHGVIINSRVAKDDEQLTSPKNFAEAMQKRGWVMVRAEDFKNFIMS